MKRFKKLTALLVALAMMVALVPSVFAEETAATPKISTTADDTHTYSVYQILKGDVSGSTLSNVELGQNAELNEYTADDESEKKYTLEEFLNALTALGSNATDDEVLTVIDTYVTISGSPIKTVTKDSPAEVPAGYYRIVDQKGSIGDDDAYTKYITQVVGDITITRKTDKPSVEKKVYDDQYKSDDDFGTGYNDVADYDLGETHEYHLIGLIPDMTYYDKYTYIFHDTLSKGLTLDSESIKVYISDDKIWDENDLDVTSYFTKDVGEYDATDGTTFSVSVSNLKSVTGVKAEKYIIVKYTAKLNENAVIGGAGNPNNVYLEYSNNPNDGGQGTTTTPKDYVVVFTYTFKGTKVDGDDPETVLTTAEFKLQNTTEGSPDYGKWAVVDANGKLTGWSTDGTALKTTNGGTFTIIGLDAGTYKLRETTTPPGYNTMADKTLVITTNNKNTQSWNGEATVLENISLKIDDNTAEDGVVKTGTVSATIENYQGSTLPSTGGIGTTIFYTIGGIMVVAAVVLLITKKRMKTTK